MIYVDAEKLRVVMTEVLSGLKVNGDSIRHLTDSVLEASLKGIDTHGLALFPHYVEGFSKGRLKRNPQFRILKNNAAAKVVDADGAVGHHAGIFAMDFALTWPQNTVRVLLPSKILRILELQIFSPSMLPATIC